MIIFLQDVTDDGGLVSSFPALLAIALLSSIVVLLVSQLLPVLRRRLRVARTRRRVHRHRKRHPAGSLK